MKKRIVIFASGSGTNTQNVIQYFQHSELAEVVHVLSNKKNAKVLTKCDALNIKASAFSKEALLNPQGVLNTLQKDAPDLIVLAGFLLKFPAHIITAYPKKIINIHPSLLPKFGGKGMYGAHVHEAIVAAKETETGITIHFVNNDYDKGSVIFQKKTKIEASDTALEVAKKVHNLEYEWLPKIIEILLSDD